MSDEEDEGAEECEGAEVVALRRDGGHVTDAAAYCHEVASRAECDGIVVMSTTKRGAVQFRMFGVLSPMEAAFASVFLGKVAVELAEETRGGDSDDDEEE